MTHIWQSQQGMNVPAEAAFLLWENEGRYLNTYFYNAGLLEFTKFHDLNIEQQAKLIAEYCYAKKHGRYPFNFSLKSWFLKGAEKCLRQAGIPLVPPLPEPHEPLQMLNDYGEPMFGGPEPRQKDDYQTWFEIIAGQDP